jgi:hypothetical protein
MSLPNEELLSVEDPSVSSARSEAPSELKPTVLVSHESETASTVLATDATSHPTKAATPASQTELVQLQQVAAIPSRPKAEASWKSWFLPTLAGITIFGVATSLSDLVYWNVTASNSPLNNPIIPNWYSQIWVGLFVGWSLVVPFFFGARFGPWVGLGTAIIGSVLGDVIWGLFYAGISIGDFIVGAPYLIFLGIGWYWYVAIAACGFFPGLAYRRSRGRNLSIRAALLFSLLGMSIYSIIGTLLFWFYSNITASVHPEYQYPISYVFQYIITSILASLSALLLLLIALSISNAVGKNHIP